MKEVDIIMLKLLKKLTEILNKIINLIRSEEYKTRQIKRSSYTKRNINRRNQADLRLLNRRAYDIESGIHNLEE